MADNKKYEKLLQPGYIGKVKTRNRIYKTAASMMSWHEDELHMNQTTLAFYESVARGGVGLICVEAPTMDYPKGARWRPRYRMDDDKYIEGMKELVDVIHKYGCPTFMQMEHDGPWQSPLFSNAPATFEGPPIGASPVNIDSQADFHRDMIRELTVPEIKEIIQKCINAAFRAKKAGFDGVDINAGSSHIFHNFLSPFWNRRQDEYGGTPEKRARFTLEVIHGIKGLCGADFPVVVCMNGIEVGITYGVENSKCLTFADAKQNAKWFEEAGADALMIRNGWLAYHAGGFLPDYMFYPEPPIPLEKFPPEYNWHGRGAGANIIMCEEIGKLVKIPIIAVGKIKPELGEKYLSQGRADFIGMHRALMSDPDMPHKLAENRLEDIAPCTACGNCLDQSVTFLRHCRINAAMGTPYNKIERAEKAKKVVVIGGGPGGMEAARVAALRGHDVTILEKSNRLGGLLPLAGVIKGIEMENLPDMVRYLATQLKKLGVKVDLGREADAAAVLELKPHAVIVATGGELTTPELKGIDRPHVLTSPALHRRIKPYLKAFGERFMGWATKFFLPVGRNAVVFGTGLHGMEVAEFLIKRGRNVTLVDTADRPGEGMLDFRLGLVMDWFGRKGIKIYNGIKDVEITSTGISFKDKDGNQQVLPAHTVITTAPLKPDRRLYNSLQGRVAELYAIGDCKDPRMIVDAIREGWETARTL